MDKRKGLVGGYRKLGPVACFLFWCTIGAIILAVLFFMIQQETGATKEGQIAAQLDRDSKHNEEIGQLEDINSKIGVKNRPYLGIEKFSMERDNNHLTPYDYVTIYIKNYGGVSANEVTIYIDIFDDIKLKWKKDLPFRKFIPDKFAILPGNILKFDKEMLIVGKIINPYKEYDEWLWLKTAERYEYFKQRHKYPSVNIYSVTVEITYIGLEKHEPLFSLKSDYSCKYKNGGIVWSLNRSEVK